MPEAVGSAPRQVYACNEGHGPEPSLERPGAHRVVGDVIRHPTIRPDQVGCIQRSKQPRSDGNPSHSRSLAANVEKVRDSPEDGGRANGQDLRDSQTRIGGEQDPEPMRLTPRVQETLNIESRHDIRKASHPFMIPLGSQLSRLFPVALRLVVVFY